MRARGARARRHRQRANVDGGYRCLWSIPGTVAWPSRPSAHPPCWPRIENIRGKEMNPRESQNARNDGPVLPSRTVPRPQLQTGISVLSRCPIRPITRKTRLMQQLSAEVNFLPCSVMAYENRLGQPDGSASRQPKPVRISDREISCMLAIKAPLLPARARSSRSGFLQGVRRRHGHGSYWCLQSARFSAHLQSRRRKWNPMLRRGQIPLTERRRR
jgi:hypothetical protein